MHRMLPTTPAPSHRAARPPRTARTAALLRGAAWVLVAAVLAGVFALYLQPDFVVALADQAWACL